MKLTSLQIRLAPRDQLYEWCYGQADRRSSEREPMILKFTPSQATRNRTRAYEDPRVAGREASKRVN